MYRNRFSVTPTDSDNEVDSVDGEDSLPQDDDVTYLLDPEDTAYALSDLSARIASGDLTLDFGEVGRMFDVAAEAETKDQEITQEHMNDVLGAVAEDVSELPDFVPDVLEACTTQPAFLPLNEMKFEPMPTSGTLRIQAHEGKIYIRSDSFSHQIGVCKRGTVLDEPFIVRDPFPSAHAYNEVVRGKGSCLGFSVFCHNSAILMLADGSGIIEPIEGHDLHKWGLNIEVTGNSYKTRESTADVVISKYELLRLLPDLDRERIFYINLSLREDNYDTGFFTDSALNQGASPYTKQIAELHSLTRQTRIDFFDGVGQQYATYLSKQPVSERNCYLGHFDAGAITSALRRYSKLIDGNRYLPAPFRVLPGRTDRGSVLCEAVVFPFTSAPKNKSGYHTFDYERDPTPELLHMSDYHGTIPEQFHSPYNQGTFEALMRIDIFKSVYLESVLASKITGRSGHFYDKHNHAGVAWSKHKAGAATWYVCYYVAGEPIESCGKWSLIDEANDIWQSPTIKMSANDLQYQLVLPYRFLTLIMGTLANTTPRERPAIILSLSRMLAMIRYSSWQTSSLMGDMRFLTLCRISTSGDVAGLVNKISKRVTNFLSFPDAYFLRVVRERYCSGIVPDLSKTPLFGLPMRFIAIEKDMALFTQWHMRQCKHSQACMAKLVAGAVMEVEQRPTLVDCLEKQVSYLRRAHKSQLGQGDFEDFMSSMPKIPHYNHIAFMGLAALSSKSLLAGMRQDPTKMTLTGLLSDHHAITVRHSDEPFKFPIKSSRVADNLKTLLDAVGGALSIYQLCYKLAIGPVIVNMFLIHPKDSKSKDREIAQMYMAMRVFQFMSECMVSVYSDAEEADAMQDPEKFSKFATVFSGILRKQGVTRSEDKEFFCGHMHPECMSLATLAVARVTGSTSLVLSSSIQRMDTYRWTVAPQDFILGETHVKLEIQIAQVEHGKERKPCIAIKNYMHMQQGIRALGAALITTVVAVGLKIIMSMITFDLSDLEVMTTSDDSVRGAVRNRPSRHNAESVERFFTNFLPAQLYSFMQIDSGDKAILSSRIAEFNNTVVGPNGLFPTSTVHSFLAIQPLIGESPMEDIMATKAASTASASWGDSLDTMRAAYDSMVLLLCQRWLITEEEVQKLMQYGLLPSCDEELLQPMLNLRDDVALKCLRMLKDEDRDEVMTGELALSSVLRNIRIGEMIKSLNANRLK